MGRKESNQTNKQIRLIYKKISADDKKACMEEAILSWNGWVLPKSDVFVCISHFHCKWLQNLCEDLCIYNKSK